MNKVLHGDCLELMKALDDNSIDLTVTSPPYDNLRTYNGYTFDFEGIAKELYRVTKEGGVVVWVVGDATIKGSETGTSFKQALFFKEIGFNLHEISRRACWGFFAYGMVSFHGYASLRKTPRFLKGHLNNFESHFLCINNSLFWMSLTW